MSQLKNNLDGSITINLKHPFAVNGVATKVMTMRRPKVKDLRTASRYGDKPADQEVGLLAVLTGCVPEDLDEMDAADYGQLQGTFRTMVESDAEPAADVGTTGEAVQDATK